MSKTHRGRRRAAFAAGGLVAIVVLALAGVLLRALREQRLRTLFTGPETLAGPRPAAFYPGVRYNLAEYERAPNDTSDNQLATGPAVDAATGASRIYRLYAPTVYREAVEPDFTTITEPLDGAVFPPNLCAPFIEWADAHNDLWLVTVDFPGPQRRRELLARERRLRLPEDLWREITASPGVDVTVQVRGVKRSGLWGKSREDVHVSRKVSFRVSADRADDAIVYRFIDPPFLTLKTPDMMVREIGRLEPRPFVRSRGQYCINCHSFSSSSGLDGTVAIQVRYLGQGDFDPTTYLVLCDIARRGAVKLALPFRIHMTTFMSWSPDGRTLAFAANQDLGTVPPSVFETQNAVQATSDLAILDRASLRTWLLPGASDPATLETFPRWTPDGRSIVYSSAPGRRPAPMTEFRLRVIPYNDGRGGTPGALPGIPEDARSRVYPRFSPDNRWFTFVETSGGAFIKPSGDVCIMPADFSRPPRPLESNAPWASDSWYSWSSNSRWIVFTSKRDDGIFARLYLTHIDDEGHASPPVRLPISGNPLMSFNVPEFVEHAPAIEEERLFEDLRVEKPAVPAGKPGGARD